MRNGDVVKVWTNRADSRGPATLRCGSQAASHWHLVTERRLALRMAPWVRPRGPIPRTPRSQASCGDRPMEGTGGGQPSRSLYLMRRGDFGRDTPRCGRS